MSSRTSAEVLEAYIYKLREMDDEELVRYKTETTWRMNSIEGQLIDPANDARPDGWRRNAKLALHYARRELSLINDVMAERRPSLDPAAPPVVAVWRSLIHLYEAAQAFRTDDSDEAWERLEATLDKCDSIRFMVTS